MEVREFAPGETTAATDDDDEIAPWRTRGA
jgi:hypothetical protein